MFPKPMLVELAARVRRYQPDLRKVADDAILAVNTGKRESVKVMIRSRENRSRWIFWGNGMAPVLNSLPPKRRAS
jgi:hypothetical protein